MTNGLSIIYCSWAYYSQDNIQGPMIINSACSTGGLDDPLGSSDVSVFTPRIYFSKDVQDSP